jgi:ATP-binding cassette, subfamily B, bacterial HlyB/CyaB
MTVETVEVQRDPGLFALAMMLRLHGLSAQVAQIRQKKAARIGIPEMLRCAKEHGLTSRTQVTDWKGLIRTALPAIAGLRDGGFLIAAKIAEDQLLVQHPEAPRPEVLTRLQFESVWNGRLVEMRAGAEPQPTRRLKQLCAELLASWRDRLVMATRSLTASLPDARDRLLQIARDRVLQMLHAISNRLGGQSQRFRHFVAARFHLDELPPGPTLESTTTDSAGADDSAIAALVLMLRIHGIGADPEQIRHRCATAKIGVTEMLRCAKELGLKASVSVSSWARLAGTPVPGIAALRDGSFLILGKVAEDKLLVQYPSAPRPEAMTREQFEAVWDGRLVLMARRSNLTDLSRRFDISWFVGAIHKYRHLLGEVIVASFFLQLFALVSPLFFQVVIDKVLVHRSISTLDVLAVGLLGISLFEAILSTLRTYLFAHTTNRIDVELGARLFRHLLALPIAYFQARRVGDSVARVRELENIRQFLTSSALTLVIDLVFTFVFLAVMFYYAPALTFVVLGAFPFYIAISVGATPAFRRRLDDKFRRGSENQAFLVESVTGVETLKAMAVEPQMQRRWEEQLAGYVAASFRVISLNNTASQAVQLVNKVTIVLILYFGAKLVIDGSISVGELVAFNMLASHVSTPVLRLAQMWQDFHQARLSVARLGDILNTVPEPTFSPGRAALPAIRGEVSFEHVTFRYRVDSSQILHDVSFKVLPGQVVGLVGSSGSGKSTLAKLVQRLYVPESGRVLVDGVDLAMVDLAWLRRQIGVVLQENVLFNCSVAENIALADPAVPMDTIIAAAKLAGAHDFILELGDGYDTVIGERGSSLSGGQRQRIAIARALMSNPRILIFDEATSALDYESERAIQENMKQIAMGRTVFIIAHRLSTVRHADRIITIERGRIVEDGNHDQLIRSNGRYAKLHYLQAGIQ